MTYKSCIDCKFNSANEICKLPKQIKLLRGKTWWISRKGNKCYNHVCHGYIKKEYNQLLGTENWEFEK